MTSSSISVHDSLTAELVSVLHAVRAVSRSDDLRGAVEALLRHLVQTVEAAGAVVLLPEETTRGEEICVTVDSPPGSDPEHAVLYVADRLAAWDDGGSEDSSTDCWRLIECRSGARGVLGLRLPEDACLSTTEDLLLTLVADELAAAASDAADRRELEADRAELDRASYSLFALRHAAGMLASSTDVHEIASMGMDMLIELMQGDTGYMVLCRRASSGFLVLRDVHGSTPGGAALFQVPDYDAAAAAWFVSHPDPVRRTLLQNSDDPEMQHVAELLTGNAMPPAAIWAPLIADDVFLGLVALSPKRDGQEFLYDEVQVLATISRQLAAALSGAMAREKGQELTRFVQDKKSERYTELVGHRSTLKEFQALIAAHAEETTPLLLEGERGTGKELLARQIHAAGPFAAGPFVSIDSSEVIESPWGDNLIGDYHRLAADRPNSQGICYLDLAKGGMLLIKNVESLPMRVQERLARTLGAASKSAASDLQVRIMATCRGDLSQITRAGEVAADLTKVLRRSMLVVPSLRDRKRDIPELAKHFVLKHSGRLDRDVTSLDDHAVIKFVSYDYTIANVQELEDAVERAVILSEGEEIRAEEVFLGLPPTSHSQGINLLKLPQPLVRTVLRAYPTMIRVAVAAIFAGILTLCFFGRVTHGNNLATTLVWSVWWPSLVLSFFFAGRAWCAICPMSTAGALAQRFAGQERRIPAWMKNHDAHIVMAGFFAIIWVEEATGMRHDARATGLLLLFILSGALIISVLFPRRTWCRHLCPLGGFAGVCASSSFVELRPTLDVCSAKCRDHFCYKGAEDADGCPMFQHAMFVDSNQHCVLCMNCVKACPNGSPQLNIRVPARELWATLGARPEVAQFVAMMLGMLIAETLILLWDRGPNAPYAHDLHHHRLLFVTALLVVSSAVPVTALYLSSHILGRDPDSEALTLFWRKACTWLPWVVGGFAAYQLSFVPQLDRVQLTVGYLPLQSAGPQSVTVQVVHLMQATLLGAGTLITLSVLWRVLEGPGKQRFAQRVAEAAAGATGITVCVTMVAVALLRPEWLSRFSVAQLGMLVLIFGVFYFIGLAPVGPFRLVLTTRREAGLVVRLLVLLIGLHSCVLGVLMLFLPSMMLPMLGFPASTPAFFASQSGVFLLLLGVCYLLALAEPALIKVILIAKAFAVAFLVVHAAFLGAPSIIWAAAAGDGAMLTALSLALWYERRPRPAPVAETA